MADPLEADKNASMADLALADPLEADKNASMVRVKAQPEASGQLAVDLLKMLDDPTYSDVQFMCKDGVRIHASRLLLMARSRVLHAMLSNGMSESRISEVMLPDIASSTLLPTLEYLYTGGIVKHEISLEVALQVILIARFWLLHEMEEHVTRALNKTVLKVTDLPTLVGHLEGLINSNILPNHSSDEVVEHIVKYLRRCESSISYLKKLSWKAMLVYLDVSKSRDTLRNLSFMEYLRLRDVLLWISYQVSDVAVAVMESSLPGEESLAKNFNALKTSEKTYLDLGPEMTHPLPKGVILKEVKEYIEKRELNLQEIVEFQHIHPVILYKVLKPLNVIHPCSVIEAALYHQAAKRIHECHEINVMKWVIGARSTCYENSGDGATLVAKRNSKGKVVRTCKSIYKVRGEYEVDFVVEGLAPDMGVGVAKLLAPCDNEQQDADSASLDAVVSLGMQHSRLYCRIRKEQPIMVVMKGFILNSKVRMVIDMDTQSCSFFLDGQLVKRAYVQGLAEELCIFGHCVYPGKLRVCLASNPDFL